MSDYAYICRHSDVDADLDQRCSECNHGRMDHPDGGPCVNKRFPKNGQPVAWLGPCRCKGWNGISPRYEHDPSEPDVVGDDVGLTDDVVKDIVEEGRIREIVRQELDKLIEPFRLTAAERQAIERRRRT